MDSVDCALRYLWKALDHSSSRVPVEARAVMSIQGRQWVLANALHRSQLSLLVHVLRVLTNETVGFALEKDISKIVALAFIIIANGYFHCVPEVVHRLDCPKRPKVESDGCCSCDSYTVSVLDMLVHTDFCTASLGRDFFIDSLMRHWHAVSVLSTAIHTGCVEAVVTRLHTLLSQYAETGADHQYDHLPLLLTARMFFSLLEPFSSHSWIKHICSKSISPLIELKEGSEKNLSSLESLSTVSWIALNDVTHPQRHNLSLLPIEEANKKLSRLDCTGISCLEVWFIVDTSRVSDELVHSVRTHSFCEASFEALQAQCLRALSRILECTYQPELVMSLSTTVLERVLKSCVHSSWEIVGESLRVCRKLLSVQTPGRHVVTIIIEFMSALTTMFRINDFAHEIASEMVRNVIFAIAVVVPYASDSHDILCFLAECTASICFKQEWNLHASTEDRQRLLFGVLTEYSKVLAPTETKSADSKVFWSGKCRSAARVIEFLFEFSVSGSVVEQFANTIPVVDTIVSQLSIILCDLPDCFPVEAVRTFGLAYSNLRMRGLTTTIPFHQCDAVLSEESLLDKETGREWSSVELCWMAIMASSALIGDESSLREWFGRVLKGDADESESSSSCTVSLNDDICIVQHLWGEFYRDYSQVSLWIIEEQLGTLMSLLSFDLDWCVRARCELKQRFVLSHFHSSLNISECGISPQVLHEQSLRKRIVDMFESGDVNVGLIWVTSTAGPEATVDCISRTYHNTEARSQHIADDLTLRHWHQILSQKIADDTAIIQLLGQSPLPSVQETKSMFCQCCKQGIPRRISTDFCPDDITLARAELVSAIVSNHVTVGHIPAAKLTNAMQLIQAWMNTVDERSINDWFVAVLALLALDVGDDIIMLPPVDELGGRFHSWEMVEVIVWELLRQNAYVEIKSSFRRASMPCLIVVRCILKNWFFGWLPLKDIMLVTLLRVFKGPNIVGFIIVKMLQYLCRHIDGAVESGHITHFLASVPREISLEEILGQQDR